MTIFQARDIASVVRRTSNSEKFCSAYKASCSRECARVKSTVKTQVCRSTKGKSGLYDLNCRCNNGKLETQHALASIRVGGSHTYTVVGTKYETASESDEAFPDLAEHH